MLLRNKGQVIVINLRDDRVQWTRSLGDLPRRRTELRRRESAQTMTSLWITVIALLLLAWVLFMGVILTLA